MNWPTLLFAVILALIFVGIACLLALFWYWTQIGRVVGELWPKLVAILIQMLAGLAALSGAYAVGARKEDWLPTAISGACCVALWGILKELVENRVKAFERQERAGLEEAKRQSELRTDLSLIGSRFS